MKDLLETEVKHDRQQLIEMVRRWGDIATDAVLDPVSRIFTTPFIKGFIGYNEQKKHAVVYGNPICAPEDAPALTLAFEEYCKKQGWNTVYVGVTGDFALWAKEHVCEISIEFGHSLSLDPHFDPREQSGSDGHVVRRKVRHALKKGILVEEYLGDDPKIESAIESVGDKWLQARKGPQVHLARVRLFEDRHGKRWLYAKHGDEIVGVVNLIQLQAKGGWHLNHLMFTPDVEQGTPELLVVSALNALAEENCHFVTFGYVSKRESWELEGLGKFSTKLANTLILLAKKLFPIEGQSKFWKKFNPVAEPTYLLFRDPAITMNLLLSLKNALNVHVRLPTIFPGKSKISD